MGEGGSDIIIKGGSVELEFDETVYRKQSGDPKKYKHDNRKISRIEIYDEQEQEVKTYSAEGNNGLKWTVKIITA